VSDPTPETPPPVDAPSPATDDAPARRLSIPRLVAVIAVVGAAAIAGASWVHTEITRRPTPRAGTWFAPYVDTTLPPTYAFQSSTLQPARQVALGFIVASTPTSCTPSWGAAYSLAGADQALAIGSRIAQLRDNGAQGIVSFGGQANAPLWTACRTTAALTRAYRTVIDRYNLNAIDLDVEGSALSDAATMQRNATAIAAIQKRYPRLTVWLTLPVATSGLQDNARAALAAMLQSRVSLDGVNLMTMDFSPAPGGSELIGPVTQALRAAHAQIGTVDDQYGVRLSSGQVWRHMGATVMIGENDVSGERFSTADATSLVAFARSTALGRISMWSINRDRQCGSVYSVTGVLSNSCSGTPEPTLGFAHTFGALRGTVPAHSGAAASATLPPAPDTNPADAPYPTWSATEPYPQGYKVVENGLIYQALYYTSGNDPSAEQSTGAPGPWLLVGPVLPGSHPRAPVRLASGTYPAWSAGTAYHTGNRVLSGGEPYQAKWNNQGASPAGAVSDPYGNPWKPLFTIPGEPALP
jgi:chitinase